MPKISTFNKLRERAPAWGYSPPSRVEERRLVAAARAGDARALRRVLEMTSGPAFRFGRGFCRDLHDAEDVTQEVLAALVRNLDGFRGDASLATWAYTVARNACARRRRRAGRESLREVPLEGGAGERAPALEIPDPAGDPEREHERAELREALERAIAALPAAQREVLVLRDVEGLPAREVGRILRLGERAVKSRLHRARLGLRAALEPFVRPARADRPPAPARPRAAERAARCPDVALLLSRYLEGELDARVCARLDRHVRDCPRCGAACDGLRAALGECRRLGAQPPPEGVRRAVRQAIRAAVAGMEPRLTPGR